MTKSEAQKKYKESLEAMTHQELLDYTFLQNNLTQSYFELWQSVETEKARKHIQDALTISNLESTLKVLLEQVSNDYVAETCIFELQKEVEKFKKRL